MKIITEKLNEIQKTLKAHKSNYNSFAKFNYRSCEDILEALKKHLSNNLTVTLSDEMVVLGNRFYVKATATLSNGEEQISCSAFAREEETKKGMDGAQITGSASSYARKYALSGLFCIDDNKDADDLHKPLTDAQKMKDQALKKRIEGANLIVDDLTEDQVMNFVVPMEWKHKYSGITLKDVAKNITETGTAVGVEWLEKVADQEMKTDKNKQAQAVIQRFLEEVVPQFGLAS